MTSGYKMTYNDWKLSEFDESPPSKERLRADLAEIEKEIAWNERRLADLVFGEEDRQLIEDMVAELRQERQQLLAVLHG
jgi:hypothetical protein